MFNTALRTTSHIARRGFASSTRASDVSKVTLLGRLGAEPVQRESAKGAPYYTYIVATSVGSPRDGENGEKIQPPTSWHTVYAFNDKVYNYLSTLPKGATVYVEADLEMRREQGPDDAKPHDRILLTHRNINVISKPKTAEETSE